MWTRHRVSCRSPAWALVILSHFLFHPATAGAGTRDTDTYRRMKAYLDAIPAIDTHDHIWRYEKLSQVAAKRLA